MSFKHVLEVLHIQYFWPTLEPTLFLALEIFKAGIDMIIFHSLLPRFEFACRSPLRLLNIVLKLYTVNGSRRNFSAVHSYVLFLVIHKLS